MVIFENRESAIRTERCIQALRARKRHRAEFKFSKCSDSLRDDFFSAVGGCSFRFRALIVEKDRVRNSLLRGDHDAFYRFFIAQLVRRASCVLENARLNVDGSGDRHFQRALKQHIRREIPGRMSGFQMLDSKRDQLMQLADMCIGAVARAYRPYDDRDRWLRMLQSHVDDIWQFR